MKLRVGLLVGPCLALFPGAAASFIGRLWKRCLWIKGVKMKWFSGLILIVFVGVAFGAE